MQAPEDYVARFDEMFGVAYRAAYAVLGERGDAEDCAQDTLAKALVRWHRVGHHPIPWTARVATNAAIDRWRRRSRTLRGSWPDDEIIRFGDPSLTDPTHPLAIVRQRNDLVRALRALPRRQREAVVLRHLLDLSEADTATALKCSPGTVKSATSRGLAKLRELLDDPTAFDLNPTTS
ncbi:SigE family RNA polymerase sigma factor [Ilumatobacter coccineus]|uniref:SigE family RNA polymerase sigma factor n=1 Tax=Ilumatobacter coccineus TaxID=467094 RepID=UPI0003448C14|nr:SigE family RNA polymerase sigma factor [Ilumatobacter coccineus]